MGCDLPEPETIAPFKPFDGPKFAKWLRRWMSAEDLQSPDLAQRSGLSVGMIHDLRRGAPAPWQVRNAGRTSPKTFDINSIAKVAHGLGLEFSYVAAKGGLGGESSRWAMFTALERDAIASRLGVDDADADALDAAVRAITYPTKGVN